MSKQQRLTGRRKRMSEMERRLQASFARQLGCKSIEEVDEIVKKNLEKSRSTKSE